MKQSEMSKYLKLITIGTGVLFLLFVLWFLPGILKRVILSDAGSIAYWSACTFIWITAVPCLLGLWKFWGICVSIGADESFSRKNAQILKQMSHYFLTDSLLYVLAFVLTYILGWYRYTTNLLFCMILVLFICLTLTILCAALSHLVYKAAQMKEYQDMTI